MMYTRRKTPASSTTTTVQNNTIYAKGSQSPEKVNVITRPFAKLPLLAVNEIEEWRRDNLHINSGYRALSNSYLRSLYSLSYLHNETVNIYTHLIGAIAVLPIWYYVENMFMTRYPTASQVDKVVFDIFFLTCGTCLTLSTIYHIMLNHSRKVASTCLLMDFLGILLFIVGSFYPGVYYGFYCEKVSTYSYWTMITTLGIGSIVACAVPAYRAPKWRTMRTLMFVAVALSGIVPIAHGIMLHGAVRSLWHMGAIWYIIEGLIYLSGALIYMHRLPESLKPGAFDYWCHAHQIFHVAVLLGAMSHLRAILVGFDYNHNPMTRRC